MPDWIEHLGEIGENLSLKLLKEALQLIRDDTVQLKYARAYIEAYPELIKGECAAFIAAYDEVKESLGCKGAKQAVMAEYKGLYGRRRNFMAEMVRYGMKKEKK